MGASSTSTRTARPVPLDAKLIAPAPRAAFVSRSGLIDSARDAANRFVCVSASAGYGKSSMLAEWADGEDRPVAWVSLDRFDDDPVTLLTLLATSFARATGGRDDLAGDMRVPPSAALGRAAPMLAAALRSAPTPFVMMLDDLHCLESGVCDDVLTVVMGGVPGGSQLVAASRAPQMQAASRRVEGDVLEIGAADLALDAAGVRTVFARAHVDVAGDDVEAILAHTEGWPVGVHLAASVSAARGEVLDISGDDRFVTDYLYRESLSALPAQTRRFLIRSSVLDVMSDALCAAVADDPDGAPGLRDLEESNVFLVPLDRTRDLYRYHQLYREFLLGELRHEDEEAVADLHRRAADWYEANDQPAMAVEHLLQTPDRDRCARLIDAIGYTTYQAGDLATVRRWVQAVGEESIRAYPPLAVLAGWIAALTAHDAEAEKWATRAESLSFARVPADGSASYESARAMLRAAMCAHGLAAMREDAALAMNAEPAWSVWRDQALTLAGDALLLSGEVDAADALFAQAAARAAEAGNFKVQVLNASLRAMIAIEHGKWDDADHFVGEARRVIDAHRLHTYSTALGAYAAAARIALHRGDLHAAERELAHAMRERAGASGAMPTVAVRLRLHLATTWWAMGDAAAARQLVREVEDILLRRPDLGALVDDFARLRDSVTDPRVAAGGPPPLTPAELRLLPYLQTYLTIPEIASRLFVSRNTVSTQVGSIYRKLGVSSRGEAVERATSVGLLGGS
nr:LuxR family transcriptional regulator [Microbacterium thalassium]